MRRVTLASVALITIIVGIVALLPFENAARRRRGELPLIGPEARSATIRFALLFIPLALVVLVLSAVIID